MKKTLFLLVLTTLVYAQDTGSAASSATAASTSQWQNWVFTSTAIVTASAGVLLLAFDNGSTANSH